MALYEKLWLSSKAEKLENDNAQLKATIDRLQRALDQSDARAKRCNAGIFARNDATLGATYSRNLSPVKPLLGLTSRSSSRCMLVPAIPQENLRKS